MATVARNIKAINQAVVRLNVQSKRGRNDAVRDYYNHLPEGVRDSVTFHHGTFTYRDRTIDQFFKQIENRPIQHDIMFTGGDDTQLLARAANEMSNMVYARALPIRDTGEHLWSLTMFQREVGHKHMFLIKNSVKADGLVERPIVSIVAMTAYASTLEMRGMIGGILYHVARQLRAKYRRQLAVKYDYVSGRAFGLAGGTFPRIQIANIGNLKSRLQRPGRKTKSRFRRNYAQVKGRQS